MNCPKCGAENPENAYFCGSCGHQMQSAMTQPQGPANLNRPPQPPVQRPLDTNAPGAGLAPQPQAYQPPQVYQEPSQQYGPPPGAGYGQSYAQPSDGNTSGMGAGYGEPPEASGWTFAGFVPFGIYAFVMGNVMWGVIGLVTQLCGLYLIYSIFVGVQGKKLAWQGKRFASLEEYNQAQSTWNIVGVVCLAVGVLLTIAAFALLVWLLTLS